MDTSETYIKMCEKAEEIQKRWEQSVGDYLSNKLFGNCFIVEVQTPIGLHEVIWLPRQDQLQEMMMLNIPQEETFYFLRDFTLGHLKKYPESWEQIWLIAVMKTKFNKIWNGEEWIK